MLEEDKKTIGISVLLPVYQKEKPEYLQEAIGSIMHQTLLPNEIVLIKDGPLPEALNQVITYMQEKCSILRVYSMKKHAGLGKALAYGLTLCENELVARMDSDDRAVPGRLEWQSRYMEEHPEISVLGGFIQEFDRDSECIGKRKTPVTQEEILLYAVYRNPMNHMTVMFRKSKVFAAGNYQDMPYLEDYYLWMRMLAKGEKMHNLPVVLVHARADQALYGRRGGVRYFRQYMKFRSAQKKLGCMSRTQYLKAVFLTAGITLLPLSWRRACYQKVLRE